jgi:hypothetical protein
MDRGQNSKSGGAVQRTDEGSVDVSHDQCLRIHDDYMIVDDRVVQVNIGGLPESEGFMS